MRPPEDNESYVLVVQDVFSRFLWTEALVNKKPQTVAQAFEKILQKAGNAPRSLTTDQGPEFSGPFTDMLNTKGIVASQKRPEDKNTIATLDTAIWEFQESARGRYAKGEHK